MSQPTNKDVPQLEKLSASNPEYDCCEVSDNSTVDMLFNWMVKTILLITSSLFFAGFIKFLAPEAVDVIASFYKGVLVFFSTMISGIIS